jgi:hypothetical protein
MKPRFRSHALAYQIKATADIWVDVPSIEQANHLADKWLWANQARAL